MAGDSVRGEKMAWNVSEFHRRDLLRVGGAGLLGLTLPKWLKAADQQPAKARRAPAKSVIFLFQWGGPSHVDTFDMKPDAPDGYRSLYKTVPTSVPGMMVCEHLPKTAKIMHQFSQIRTVHHRMNNHNSAGYTALTGYEPPIDDQRLRESLDLSPSYGSVVDAIAPNTNGMPTSVAFPYQIADGSITPGQRASFLGKQHDPLFFKDDPNAKDFRLSQLSLPSDISLDRLSNRRGLQEIINQQARELDQSDAAKGLDAYYTRAGDAEFHQSARRVRFVARTSCSARSVRTNDVWTKLPAGSASGGIRRQVCDRVLCSQHRWPKQDRWRMGHTRLRQYSHV